VRFIILAAFIGLALAGCDRDALHEQNVAMCRASGLEVMFKIDPLWGHRVDYRCVPKGAPVVVGK